MIELYLESVVMVMDYLLVADYLGRAATVSAHLGGFAVPEVPLAPTLLVGRTEQQASSRA